MSISLYSIPAILVLVAKVALFFYARKSSVRDPAAILFLVFLSALTVQNIAEIGILNFHGAEIVGRDELFNGYLYFAASVVALAALVHLTLILALDWGTRTGSTALATLLYVPALVMVGLLFTTDYIIAGFRQLNYTYGQIAGNGYWLFEIYVLVYCLTTLVLMYYGAGRQATSSKRLKNKLMGYGMLPMGAIIALVMVMERQGLDPEFNTTATLPIGITVFLAITAYAIYQFRLFDIDFYIPGSRVRKRKTAFYDRIRKLVSEIAELPSASAAVSLLADVFKCPIVLLDENRKVLASAGNVHNMNQLSAATLAQLTHILVREEVSTSMPQMHQDMARHHVSAVVPFYPGSRSASGWLLMGESFTEQVYSPMDFKLVEQVFDKMADLFLEGMVSAREEKDDMAQRLLKLEAQQEQLRSAYQKLEQETEILRRENERLLLEQPADSFSLISTANQESSVPATVTLLGRDKPMLQRLREHFPQAAHYVAANSTSFKRQNPSDVLICRIEDEGKRGYRQFLKLIIEFGSKSAFLLYGPGATEFVRLNQKALLGGIIEVFTEDLSTAALVRRVNAISELRKAMCSVADADNPLIGRSQVFIDVIADAIRMSRFFEPVVIKSADIAEAVAAGNYIHNQSTSNGEFVVVRSDGLNLESKSDSLSAEDERRLKQSLKQARGGSLMIDNIAALPRKIVDHILALAQERGDVRVMVGFDRNTDTRIEELQPALQTFVLELPALEDRKGDLQLLAHYYTLLHNLQSDQNVYLEQSELESLQLDHHVDTLATLKGLIFERLGTKEATQASQFVSFSNDKSKTLEEHVAEFEAAILKETLERCDGNKSKAARLLGLRPNTLHYKLERLGLTTEKKNLDSGD
jgi:DNA-binding NtrC family response regulator